MVAGLPKVVATDFCDPVFFCNSFSLRQLTGGHAFRDYHLAHSEPRLCLYDSSCLTHALSEARRHNQVRLSITTRLSRSRLPQPPQPSLLHLFVPPRAPGPLQ